MPVDMYYCSQDIDGNIAKQVLVFLVVGINSDVYGAIGYFGTTSAKAGALYILMWDAIQYLELTCGLKVVMLSFPLCHVFALHIVCVCVRACVCACVCL